MKTVAVHRRAYLVASLLAAASLSMGSAPPKEKAPNRPMLRFDAIEGGGEVLVDPGEVCDRLVSPQDPAPEAWACAADTIQKAASAKRFRWKPTPIQGLEKQTFRPCPGHACVHCRTPGGGMRCVPCLVNPRTCESICVCP
jgi:hypothetical protein